MESYRVCLDKTVIKTLDAVSLDYDGMQKEKMFACTITSRKKYASIYQFRNELYEFLSSINYKYAIKGYMEFHEQRGREDKVHAHCVLYYGNPPKGNKSNAFYFRIAPLTDPVVWDKYCRKSIMETLERHHNIKTGVFYYTKKPTCLFEK